MYADVIQLYSSNTLNNLPDTITKINKFTTKLEIYFNNNYFKFNKLKTECIFFHIKHMIPTPLTHIKIEIKTDITTLDNSETR